MKNNMAASKGKKVKNKVVAMFLNLISVFCAVTCVFPVIWLGYTSLKSNAEFAANVLALPKNPSMKNFIYVINKTNMPLYLFNTLRITVCVLALTLLAAFTTGYFLARFRFRFHGFLSGLYISNLFIPMHAILVPVYVMMVRFKFVDHWYATILPMVCMEMTTSLFLVRSYVETLPVEVEEAASIDGSSFSRTLFQIILPVVRPILVTIGIMSFFHCWNEFSLSLIAFSKDKLFTMSLAVMRFKGQYLSDYPQIMATIFIAIVPALVIYICFSKQIIKGMMAGAIKG